MLFNDFESKRVALMETFAWRLREYACRSNDSWPALKRAAAALYRRLQSFYGFYIPLDVVFAGQPYFPHGFGGVYISGHSTVGRRCIIFQQVTIGSSTMIDSKRLGSPAVGDDVYIGAGAKIIGKISIGNGVRIGANAVITRDVPDNSTVVGFNQILRSASPRDNRHFRLARGGWEAMTGDGAAPATPSESAILDSAFGRHQ